MLEEVLEFWEDLERTRLSTGVAVTEVRAGTGGAGTSFDFMFNFA